MARRGIAPREQMNFWHWESPQPVKSFDADVLRCASLRTEMCRAISAALRECGMTREQVAQKMSDFLGEAITKNMLDAYASEAREEHTISMIRFIALVIVIRDRRLLQLIASKFGWAVVDEKYLTVIEFAAAQEKADKMKRTAAALHRQAKKSGALGC